MRLFDFPKTPILKSILVCCFLLLVVGKDDFDFQTNENNYFNFNTPDDELDESFLKDIDDLNSMEIPQLSSEDNDLEFRVGRLQSFHSDIQSSGKDRKASTFYCFTV